MHINLEINIIIVHTLAAISSGVLPAIPEAASEAKYCTSLSVSIVNLSKIGFTCGCITECSSQGPIRCKVFATLKRTFATLSAAIDKTVGSKSLVVMSFPHASAKTFKKIP